MRNRITNKEKTLSSVAYDRILDWIQNYLYKPGDPLVESELSKKLKISRTPVREALQRLEREHIVEIRKGMGTFVAQVTLDEIRHIFELREVVEGMMCRLACRKNIDSSELVKINDSFARAKGQKDREKRLNRLQDLGQRLHGFVIDVCDNHRMVAIRRSISHQVHYHQYVSRTIPIFIEESAPEHEAILDALLSKDPERAESAMRDHLRNTLYRILDSYKH